MLSRQDMAPANQLVSISISIICCFILNLIRVLAFFTMFKNQQMARELGALPEQIDDKLVNCIQLDVQLLPIKNRFNN